MKKQRKNFVITGGLFLLFILWTMAICYVDVQMIGPRDSAVGFATFNEFFHNPTGTHMLIYIITDWLGLLPVSVVLEFAILGLVQLIKRKNLLKVDYDILILGGFYI
ncbi:phosphoesterase PA-phosphatase, partial [Coprobacillus cateniformis]|nr:phosphoesterase PA-phosphatase [Coprobacillus cateniformis]